MFSRARRTIYIGALLPFGSSRVSGNAKSESRPRARGVIYDAALYVYTRKIYARFNKAST